MKTVTTKLPACDMLQPRIELQSGRYAMIAMVDDDGGLFVEVSDPMTSVSIKIDASGLDDLLQFIKSKQ